MNGTMRDTSNDTRNHRLSRRCVMRGAAAWIGLGLLGSSATLAQSGGLTPDEAAARAQARYGGRVLAVRRVQNGYSVRIRHQDGRVAQYYIAAGRK